MEPAYRQTDVIETQHLFPSVLCFPQQPSLLGGRYQESSV